MPSSSLVSLAPAKAGPCPSVPPLRLFLRALLPLGRTHRSNQVSAPEYVFLISELAGERRFASIVAKRLESLVSGGLGLGPEAGEGSLLQELGRLLRAAHRRPPQPWQGALTHGDRRATESRDLSKYNFENKVPGDPAGRPDSLGLSPLTAPPAPQYGARALSRVLSTILSQTDSKVPLPRGYPGGDAAFFRGELGTHGVFLGGQQSGRVQQFGALDLQAGFVLKDPSHTGTKGCGWLRKPVSPSGPHWAEAEGVAFLAFLAFRPVSRTLAGLL